MKIKKISSRTLIGVICIIVALGITFGIAPLVNRATDMKIDIVRMKTTISAGAEINKDNVEIVRVGAHNLPQNVITNPQDVVGKYAKSTIYSGDYLTGEKLTSEKNSADDILNSLDGTKVALSVTIGAFSDGLSNKLQNGDIVSVIVLDKENNRSFVPAELRYVKVITTTTDAGVDKDENLDNTKATTATMLLTPLQAELLSHYNNTTNLHFSLVYRGETDKAAEFIKMQDDFLDKQKNTESESERNG